jgi:hypothetical protein
MPGPFIGLFVAAMMSCMTLCARMMESAGRFFFGFFMARFWHSQAEMQPKIECSPIP